MNEKLYAAIKDTAEKIAKADEGGFYAKCALRKVAAISPDSSLEVLIKTGKQMELVADAMEDDRFAYMYR